MGIFSSYKKYSDEDLMRCIQKQQTAAFDALYERYSKRLLHFMLKMLSNDEERAQDLLQDLFLKIAERPELFDPTKRFYTWVFTVAANMCRTEFRETTKTRGVSSFEIVNTLRVSEQLISPHDAGLFMQHLDLALCEMDFEQRQTFVLRFQEGLSLQEIAEMMNCSVGTVKSRIFYTTRKLAIELEEFKSLLKKM